MGIEDIEERDFRRKKILLGVLFLAALGCGGIFAYWMGAFGLGPTRTIFVKYNFVGGAEKGSPVRLAGIKIGKVSDIEMHRFDDAFAALKLEIDKKAFPLITEDSKFFINLAGMIGERYVEIVPGNGKLAEPGQALRGIDPPRVDQLISQGYGILENLQGFFQDNKGDFKELLSSVNEAIKSLNKFLDKATPQQRKEFQIILTNVAAMTTDLREIASKSRSAAEYLETHEGKESWNRLASLLKKGDAIELRDIRRLMLEDGMRVNLFGEKFPQTKGK